MLQRLLAPLRWLLRLVLALLILFEEWGWEPLRRVFALLARLPLVRRCEGWLSRLPPRWALVVLLLPSLLILPVKLGALWLVAQGQVTLGVGLVVAAKLAGTALLAWLFQLIQPALLQLPRASCLAAVLGHADAPGTQKSRRGYSCGSVGFRMGCFGVSAQCIGLLALFLSR